MLTTAGYQKIIEDALKAPPLGDLLSDADRQKAAQELLPSMQFINAQKQSLVFNFAEKTTETARLLGVPIESYIAAALKKPQLFYQSPETINRNVTETAATLGIQRGAFIAAALKSPSLFGQSPDTIDRNVTETAATLGIQRGAFIAAALKQPPLFCQSPDTIDRNVTETAAKLGIQRGAFIAAALKKPPLFCQSPDTIDRNVTETAAKLGIQRGAFIAAALKKPQLFCQKPETIAAHAGWMKFLEAEKLVKSGVEDFYLKNPTLLCLAEENFHLRLIFAKTTGAGSADNYNLLKRTRRSTEQEFVAALGLDPSCKTIPERSDDMPQETQGHVTLTRALVHAKILTGYKLAEQTQTLPEKQLILVP